MFIDWLPQHRNRPGQHLFFHGGQPDGARFRFTLWYVDPLHRRSPVRAILGTLQQALQVCFQILAILGTVWPSTPGALSRRTLPEAALNHSRSM